MNPSLDTSGEVPQQPGVRCPEQEISGFGRLPGALDVVKNPDNFAGGEVGGQRQPSLLAEVIAAVSGLHAVNHVLRSRVLPHNRVIDELSRGLIPHNCCLALVGNPKARDVVAGEGGPGKRFPHHFPGVIPNFLGIVLHPSGLGQNLFVLALALGNNPPRMVKNDGPGAGCSLIEGHHVGIHLGAPLPNTHWFSLLTNV